MPKPDAGGEKFKTWYDEVEMSHIIAYFVKGYENPPVDYDWFYDPAKGRVIFRMLVRVTETPSADNKKTAD